MIKFQELSSNKEAKTYFARWFLFAFKCIQKQKEKIGKFMLTKKDIPKVTNRQRKNWCHKEIDSFKENISQA